MKCNPAFDTSSPKPDSQQASQSYVYSVSGQSPLEEVVNSLTHGLGLALSIAGLSVLVVFASVYGTALQIISSAIYGATLVSLYGASTSYHAVRSVELKQRLRTIEQAFIFLLIAGTYTPFTLAVLNASWGWSLFGVAWGFALTGLMLNTLYAHHFPMVSNLLFLGIGWLSLIAIVPLSDRLPLGGLVWLTLGGVAYTFGILFLSWSRIPFSHAVWHITVIVGSTCHYIAILFYVILS